jgi:hypothetical protein
MMAASDDWNRTPEWCCRLLGAVQWRRREKACLWPECNAAETERRGVDGLLYVNSSSDRILALDHRGDPKPTQIDDTRIVAENANRLTIVGKGENFPLARAVRASCTCHEECHGPSHSRRVSAPQELFMRNIVCRCDQASSSDNIRDIPARNGKGVNSTPQQPYPYCDVIHAASSSACGPLKLLAGACRARSTRRPS